MMKKTMLNLAAAFVGIAAFKTKHVEANEPVTVAASVNIKSNTFFDPYATAVNVETLEQQLNDGGNMAFYKALLRELGANETTEKLKFLEAWRRGEGGHALHNPFNTTKDVPGDADTKYNSVGVRNYPDHVTGLRATLATLKLPYYKDIVALLMSDKATAKQIACCTSLKKWGTGDRVKKVLASAGATTLVPEA